MNLAVIFRLLFMVLLSSLFGVFFSFSKYINTEITVEKKDKKLVLLDVKVKRGPEV